MQQLGCLERRTVMQLRPAPVHIISTCLPRPAYAQLPGIGTSCSCSPSTAWLAGRNRSWVTCSSVSNGVNSNADGASQAPHHDARTPSQQDDGGPSHEQQHILLRLLKKLSAPAWLSAFVAALHKKEQQAWRLLRLCMIGLLFVVVAGTRQMMDTRVQVRTQEVLYSTFVKLLDSGHVRAARLEAGTGKLYFDITLPLPIAGATAATSSAAAAATAAAVSSSMETASTPSTTAAAPAAATTAAAALPESTAAAAPAPAAAATAASVLQDSTAVAASNYQLSPAPRFQRQFVVKLADKNDYLLASKILASGVEFAVLKKSFAATLANVVLTALAVWLPLLPLFFLFRRMMEDRTSTRKKQADGKGKQVAITFRDVAGVDAAKEELMEVVTVMKAAKSSYTRLKVKIPSGVLLCGPPGTGKTLLAKAVAGEAGLPFFAFSASEFVELYVGRGAARVREVFAEARKAAPCVVFIDELDAVGARRGMGYNDERDQTLNQLLTELDGFESRQGILFLAATNRMEILDSALLRPGRINRKVNVPLPDERGRKEILGVHLRTTPLAQATDREDACERIAKVTAGFSGAELANVVNEATLLAARQDQEVVTMRELLEGVRRTKFGVNGGASMGPATGFQKWLMDIATAPTEGRKVRNAAAS